MKQTVSHARLSPESTQGDDTLSTITARTLIVHGDRDPLYPVEQAVELFRGIRAPALSVVPNGGHGPIFGDQAAPFVRTATAFPA